MGIFDGNGQDFSALGNFSGMWDPYQIGMLSLATANNPQALGPIMDQLKVPLPGTPQFAQFMGGGPDLGAVLNGTDNTQPVSAPGSTMLQPRLSPGMNADRQPVPPQPGVQGMAPPLPGGAPMGAPAPVGGLPQASGNPQRTNPLAALQGVRPPTPSPAPQFSGGVAGTRAPTPDKVPANSAAIGALMQLLMGGKGNQPVPSLGQMLR